MCVCVCDYMRSHFRPQQTSIFAGVLFRPSVLWASPGTSDPATLGDGNRIVELGVQGPDPLACHYVVSIIIRNAATARDRSLHLPILFISGRKDSATGERTTKYKSLPKIVHYKKKITGVKNGKDEQCASDCRLSVFWTKISSPTRTTIDLVQL